LLGACGKVATIYRQATICSKQPPNALELPQVSKLPHHNISYKGVY